MRQETEDWTKSQDSSDRLLLVPLRKRPIPSQTRCDHTSTRDLDKLYAILLLRLRRAIREHNTTPRGQS